MSNELWWLTLLAIATLLVSLTVLVILLRRGGRSRELAATIDEVRKVGSQVEEMRRQNSTEHYQFIKMLRWIVAELARLVERFGFLARKDAAEPPAATRKPKTTPDDTQ